MRIIPTRVGTSDNACGYLIPIKDHPHACGDKNSGVLPSPSAQGSSTRVGTSRYSHNNSCLNKDHPHACGDKFTKSDKLSEVTGSSPRVWGQDIGCNDKGSVEGIIPTRVGTSHLQLGQKSSRQDHPHACGDKQ